MLSSEGTGTHGKLTFAVPPWSLKEESDIYMRSLAVSKRHARIYSIIYDESDTTIRPLVYVQNLSKHALFWMDTCDPQNIWRHLGTSQTFLLSHGDSITFDKKTVLKFQESAFTVASSLPPAIFDQIEKVETKENLIFCSWACSCSYSSGF